MSELEFQLFKLFTEYTMQGGTYKQSMLRINRLIDLCRDAKLFDASFSPHHLRLMMHSTFPRCQSLSFPMFCDLTPKIGESLFPSEFAESPVQAYETLINDYLIPLSKTTSARRSILATEDLNLSNNIIRISLNLHASLRRVFEAYFPSELKPGHIYDLHSSSLKNIEKLLKDIEMFPIRVNKIKLHALWRDVVIMQGTRFKECVALALIPKHSKDIGTVLSLSKFILCLYLLSIYTGEEGKSYTEKFIGLLDRIQSSLPPDIRHVNLTPSHDIMEVIKQHGSAISLPTSETDESPIIEECGELDDRHIHKLRGLFNHYAVDAAGLKRQGFLRMLKDANLVSESLMSADVDIIYSRLCEHSMDFRTFIESLDMIATKIYPGLKEGVIMLVEEHLSLIEFEVPLNSMTLVTLKEEPFVLRAAERLFRRFLEDDEVMDFSSFMKFCKSAEIFPEILSKYKLYNIFVSLVPEETEFKEGIDLTAFTEALIVISGEIWHEKKCSDVERVCYLFYRISRSSAGNTNSDDCIIRALFKRYPDFLVTKTEKKSDFRDIIDSIVQEKKKSYRNL